MAVVRITFPDRGAINQVANALEGAGERLGAREVRRAEHRSGRTAELGAEEVFALYAAVREGAYVPPRVRPLIEEANRLAVEGLAREAARPRPGNVIQMRRRS